MSPPVPQGSRHEPPPSQRSPRRSAMSLVAGLHGPTLLIQIKAFVDGIEEVGEVVVAGGVG